MCDRLAPDGYQSERIRVVDTEDEKEYACQNCTQNRQSSAPAPELTARSIEYTAIRAIHRVSGSIRHRLQVFSGSASKLFTNPNLIIVLIIVLSSCPGVVHSKPVGSRGAISNRNSKSTSQSPLIEITDWLTPETPPAVLKMDLVETLRIELLRRLNNAKLVMDTNFKKYLENYWYNDDIENIWSQQINEIEWLGKTKTLEDLEPSEELKELIDMYVRFQKFKLGIEMLKEHNAKEEQHGRQIIVNRIVEKAHKNVEEVLRSLEPFYVTWAAEDSDRRTLNDIPSLEKSVNPHWDADQETRKFHHYVVLKEFLKHLDFSHKFVETLQVKKDDDQQQQKQRNSETSTSRKSVQPKAYMVSTL